MLHSSSEGLADDHGADRKASYAHLSQVHDLFPVPAKLYFYKKKFTKNSQFVKCLLTYFKVKCILICCIYYWLVSYFNVPHGIRPSAVIPYLIRYC